MADKIAAFPMKEYQSLWVKKFSMSRTMAVIIGVTGSIGSGKSTVVRMFGELGAETASADDVARQVLSKGHPAVQDVIEEFGADIVDPKGEIDRKKLGEKIFSDENARAALNRITHPRIINQMEEIMADFRRRRGNEQNAVMAVEIPLLFECGLEGVVDAIVVASAEQETLLSRLMSRDGLSRDAALSRVTAQ